MNRPETRGLNYRATATDRLKWAVLWGWAQSSCRHEHRGYERRSDKTNVIDNCAIISGYSIAKNPISLSCQPENRAVN